MDTLKLPIRQYADQIVDSVKCNPINVVIGETGSGKTTQISQILLEAGFAGDGMIGITQPRRVAAVMVARRVAQERGADLGEEVGYAVRFEDRSSRHTKIKYLTDGTLLRECLQDPSLSKYSVLVLDEAHERSLNTDILFGLLKQLALTREKALKLVITSATLESEKFSAYFNNCPVFKVPGRTFPVDIIHTIEDHSRDYAAAAIDTAIDIHCNRPPGDILLFLTGQAEIDRAVKDLNTAVRSLPPEACGDLLVLPLYAALPPDLQTRVFAPPPPGVRRCVVATNIAETSVTVDGVVYVIDTGVVKQKRYSPATGMDSLEVVGISRVAATQRAGRAGRTRPGTCFRLYTKKKFEREMDNTTAPEIQRTSLVSAVLYLKSLTLEVDVLGFDYLDPPAREALEDALRQLYVLDAIDIDGKITAIGRKMSALPLDPSLGRALLAAQELNCLSEMMTVAAMISPESSIFLGGKGPEQLVNRPPQASSEAPNNFSYRNLNNNRDGKFGNSQQVQGQVSEQGRALLKELMRDGFGDHVLLLKLYQAWQQAGCSNDWCREVGVDGRSMRFARDIRQQLIKIMESDEVHGGRNTGTEKERRNSSKRDDVVDAAVNNDNDEETELRPLKRHKSGKSSSSYSAATGSHRAAFSDGKSLRALRKALTVGFANRLARRMAMHNGYKTLGEKSVLAQVHPSCAYIAADEDGLLPEWLVYHELVATGRTFLSKVCPVETSWVKNILPKLDSIDVARLSGGATAERAKQQQQQQQQQQRVDGSGDGGEAQQAKQSGERRNADAAVEAARARFFARKAQKGK